MAFDLGDYEKAQTLMAQLQTTRRSIQLASMAMHGPGLPARDDGTATRTAMFRLEVADWSCRVGKGDVLAEWDPDGKVMPGFTRLTERERQVLCRAMLAPLWREHESLVRSLTMLGVAVPRFADGPNPEEALKLPAGLPALAACLRPPHREPIEPGAQHAQVPE